MLQIAFVVVLAVLWMLTLTQTGGTDFLQVRVVQVGTSIVKVIDVLTGLAIIGLMVTLRGPLALAAGVLLGLWALTLLGVPRLMGVPLSPLIVFVLIVGASVHIVTHRNR